MKKYAARQVKNNVDEVLKEAQRQPIQLMKNGRPIGGIVNQELFEKVLEIERKSAQKKMLEVLKRIDEKSSQRPKPTREEMKYLLECDDEEIDNIFGEDYFEK